MKRVLLSGLLLTLMLHNVVGGENKEFEAQQKTARENEWTKNTDCGVEFWTYADSVVNALPSSTRTVFIFVEPQNFTRENLKRIFLCLSERYDRASYLTISARSDRTSLKNWVNYFLAGNGIRADGSLETSLEGRRSRPIDPPAELYNEIGYYRADYSRSDFREAFGFSDPNSTKVSIIVLRDRSIYARTGNMTSDLVRACLEEDLEEEVKQLLKNGADVNGRTKYGSTPLLVAVEFGNSRVVTLLLDRGADINQENPDGWTPLMYSLANSGHRYDVITEELLRRGVAVNARAKSGDTPLTIATERDAAAFVRQLLAMGADVNAKDRYGRTPITIAEEHGYVSILNLLKQAVTRK